VSQLLLLLGLTVLLALALTPLVRRLAHRWKLVDAPGARKIHTVSIPASAASPSRWRWC
jgi:UDP-N-acetylmuramyl pentapeptide phosphotransferase/UDP-N-acetylglucosamine-1-phosphate transferase